MKKYVVFDKKEIETLEKNDLMCSQNCDYCYKSEGLYRCDLFGVVIDTDKYDDHEKGLYGSNDRGYGFERCEECIKSELKETP